MLREFYIRFLEKILSLCTVLYLPNDISDHIFKIASLPGTVTYQTNWFLVFHIFAISRTAFEALSGSLFDVTN